jgi:(E)-4-hydroxy-3-methyl-but-2-enyl pyrophosphate reductase
MQVIVAKSAGFCWGVKRAIDKAQELARTSGKTVWTDGPLIHNPQMMERVRQANIIETDKPELLRDGILVIRAHGVPPERRKALEKLPIPLVNATCPDVAKIQGIIRAHVHRGFHVAIYGEPDHPEVQGLLGYADNRGHVLRNLEDARQLPLLSPLCLVSQSTQFVERFEAIAALLRERLPDLVAINTICASTRRRQEELREIAGQVDALVVVGGLRSANTLHLVELAASHRPTLHAQTEGDVNPEWFKGFRRVGLTAGASTPEFVIEAVRRKIEDLPPAP